MSRNRLNDETSPYLRQHKDNPVHWWAWGPEALAEAKNTGKPILLSVGYAACHWCHVMAHESFEDQETADVMNKLFVNIKVDREERPDIDQIYMSALHQLGEHGGWPLTMFLDPDGKPFFGGTYFPKVAKYGRPSFVDVLQNIARIYQDEPDKIAHNAKVITEALEDRTAKGNPLAISDQLLQDLTQRMTRAVDPNHGGISGAPKFPQWSFFWLLWRGGIRYQSDEAQHAVANTLRHICQGGIYDHLGGGFARYAVDEEWLVPHFEKMLYDNALLIDLMTEVYRETHDPLLRLRVEETVAWLEREMIAAGGGFAASLDADSEGEEGKFYVWSSAEIEKALGVNDTITFATAYDVTAAGNWEGNNILNRLQNLDLRSEEDEAHLKSLREKLLAIRDEHIRPEWDDKVLADWNGLMIAALTRAAQVFDQPKWLELAKTAFAFITNHMQVDGRLRHAYRAGAAKAPATANDYANMIWAALRLHEATLDNDYLTQACAWAKVLEDHYWVKDGGGYAMSADDTDDVIVRMCTAQDDATPNANGIMIANLAALAMLTGEERYRAQAQTIAEVFAADAGANLVAHTSLLASAIDLIAPQHVVVVGADEDGGQSMAKTLFSVSLPGALQHIVGNATHELDAPALSGKTANEGKATAYVCLGPQCSAPLTEPRNFAESLKEQRGTKAN